MEVIERARTDEAKHAIIWCVSNLVPLQQSRGGDLTVVFYERLLQAPETEVPRVFEAIGESFSSSVFDSMRRPSRTTRSFDRGVPVDSYIGGWLKELSSRQIDTILSVVSAFDLGYIYTDAHIPQVADLP
jgi:hypothetical protein